MTRSLLQGQRRAGVLLHPTSLPGPWEAGVLGTDAHRFLDWLREGGFRLWQMLPVGPVGESLSPYQMSSAFAGNPRLIDPGSAPVDSWLPAGQGAGGGSWEARRALLHEAWLGFCSGANPRERAAFEEYWRGQRSWLLPFALFREARRRHGEAGWWTWPAAVRHRQPDAMAALLKEAAAGIREIAFEQWVFDRQWRALRARAGQHGIELLGDLPIYVDLDSADVWWHRRLFRVDADGRPEAVAGVPPDYFSAEGQLWGNPLYDWEAMRADGFRWWVDRVRAQLRWFDWLRIDHFRGLEAYWQVPGGAGSARDGSWQPAPGAELLHALGTACGGQPFLAEDLGTITPEVHALRRRFGLPGMLIAQFAFDGSADNPYLPANQIADAVIYSGTHDNDTVVGWYRSLEPGAREYVHRVLRAGADDMPGALLRSVWQSRAEVAIFPLQDLLALGPEARMNTPGTLTGNWTWRFSWRQVPASLAPDCRRHGLEAGRLAPETGLTQGLAEPAAQTVPVSRV
ncbi:MAG: 4-alpha-glucanotransferase [Chromatiales bacterium]|nr:4-alpha-glucanotransferase [Chromatiales bacterium]